MSKIVTWLATLGPIGYFPAPGTMGTIATLPVVYGLLCLPILWQLTILVFVSIASYYIIDRALPYFTTSDPSQIILDEVIGTMVTFCGMSYNPVIVVAGFILFRLFDIFKPFGIRRLEKIPGACGVLIDDVVAGVCAHLILRWLL